MPEKLEAKVDRLMALLKSYGSAAVAYSGGLDSVVLAKAAQMALGDKAAAITAISASLPEGELQEASRLATQIGIRHETVETGEFENPDYLANGPDRCYYCKYEFFSRIKHRAAELGLDVVVDGSNRDDSEEYRPGTRAAGELNVRSPLAECDFCKKEIRAVAEQWSIEIYNKPASPCLSSRIAYGEPITPARLRMVDRGEQFLRGHGFDPLRVRYHRGDVARIEVSPDDMAKFADPQFRLALVEEFKAAGFRYIALDLEGFRSGSFLPIQT